MICCKIVADYSTIGTNFANIFKDLGAKGLVLWDNHKLYFANIDDNKITDKFVNKVLKKYNCNKFFLETYDEKNQPHEDDSVNAWINSQLIQIAAVELEKNHQDVLRQVSEQLTELDKELKRVIAENSEDIEEKDIDSGENI